MVSDWLWVHIMCYIKDSLKMDSGIKGIIIIADDEIGEFTEGQREFKRTEHVFLSSLTDLFFRPDGAFQQFLDSFCIPQKMAFRPGTEIRMTDHMFGTLPFFGIQFKHPARGSSMWPASASTCWLPSAL